MKVKYSQLFVSGKKAILSHARCASFDIYCQGKERCMCRRVRLSELSTKWRGSCVSYLAVWGSTCWLHYLRYILRTFCEFWTFFCYLTCQIWSPGCGEQLHLINRQPLRKLINEFSQPCFFPQLICQTLLNLFRRKLQHLKGQ